MCDYGWQGSGGLTGICYGCWNRLSARDEGGKVIHHGPVIRQGVRDIECITPETARRFDYLWLPQSPVAPIGERDL